MRSLVIGASGGIGGAVARLLLGRGEVFLAARRPERAPRGAVQLDVTDELEVHALFQSLPPLDLLVYAVGAVERAPLRELSRSRFEELLAANLTGAFLVLKHARFAPGGKGVFLGAYPRYVQVPGFSAYAAAKAGLEALLESARREYRKEGVHLALVRLPAVATGLWAPLGGPPKGALSPEAAAQRLLEEVLKDPPPEVVEI